ncbi:hypothetical protein QL285_018832 [Trifolium repens]|nr:hypothetical protein QL285_018832 [Trifolium repens]
MAKNFEDTEVDVVSLTNEDGDVGSTKNEDPDATENSSSFSDTNSDDAENSSESEVESVLVDENTVTCPIDPYDPFGPIVRKRNKKVTKHWRNFIRPLMLRLKWIELKLRQLKSQERKYSRELFQEYQWAKHKTPKHFSLEESGSKSIPFSSHQYRSKTKMRRKRKRVEETSDIAAYTSNHFIFSYLENKKSDVTDGPSDEDFGNPVITKQSSNSTKTSED